MPPRFLLALCATLFFVQSAHAQRNAGPAPLRTEVIAVTPPEGWVMSTWNGGTIEVGEFTPPSQTGGKYVDLLGYSVLPKLIVMSGRRLWRQGFPPQIISFFVPPAE